ncbi:hypothetical protein [Solidesulfovibrio sp.]|uniref:hypothetical protein n=1 Tax=Solidesulfovibrio sp. TaxID=2910990 RepID=UPI002615BA40|nr:hypothetical protein [Solidesulfovibrio sp.]
MNLKPCLTALLFMAVLALAAAAGHAGEPPSRWSLPPEQAADAYLRDLTAQVPLTAEELAAVRPILVEQTIKRRDVARARLAVNPGLAGVLALREDMRAVSRETDDKLAAVLPPEKMEQVRAYREQSPENDKSSPRQIAQAGVDG